MLKIWGRVNSINVMKVLWCADELDLDYQRIDAGMAFGLVNEDRYKAMNPNAKVPTIDDGGFVLWESNAIVRYLAARQGGALFPADAQVRADADRWMDWQLSTLAPDMGYLFWGLVRNSPQHQDPQAQAAAARSLAGLWGMVDAALVGREYLAGEALSMGDIPLGCFVHRWMELPGYPGERPRLPNLEAWYARLQQRPAYRERVMLPLT